MNYITERQIDFVSALVKDREVPAALVQEVQERLISLTKTQASELIDSLKKLPYKAKAGAAAPSAPVITVEGTYYKDGVVYKVQRSKTSGHLYAKRLIGSHFEYDPSAVKGLLPEELITLAQAREYGILYGICCICGALLTDEDSVAEGIGPVCIKKVKKWETMGAESVI